MTTTPKKRTFGSLFKDGFRLSGRAYGQSLSLGMLWLALPLMLASALLTYGTADLLSPLMNTLKAALDTGGLAAIKGLNLYGLIGQWVVTMAGSPKAMHILTLGIGLALVLGTGALLYRYILYPITLFRLSFVSSAGWHGESIPFAKALKAAEGWRSKAIGLALTNIVFSIGCSILLTIALGLFNALTIAGMALTAGSAVLLIVARCLYAVVAATISLAVRCLYHTAMFVGVNENKWGFAAFGRAISLLRGRYFKLFFGQWLLEAMAAVLRGLAATADLYLLVQYGVPPLLTILTVSLVLPFTAGYTAMLYFDGRVMREGYAPFPAAQAPQQAPQSEPLPQEAPRAYPTSTEFREEAEAIAQTLTPPPTQEEATPSPAADDEVDAKGKE